MYLVGGCVMSRTRFKSCLALKRESSFFCECFHFAMFLQLPTAQVSHFCCGRDYVRPFEIAKSEACMRALRKHAIQLLPAQSWSRRDSTVTASEARHLLITCQCGSRTYRERLTHINTHTHTHPEVCLYECVYSLE